MAHNIHVIERTRKQNRIADIAGDEFRARIEMCRSLIFMHLGHERIEHANEVTTREQRVNQMRPDESRATGHENFLIADRQRMYAPGIPSFVAIRGVGWLSE